MATINLSNQQTLYNTVAPKINDLKQAMNLRKEIWDKLPNPKKKAWIQSDKDPIMGLAWQIYDWLDENFFGDADRNEVNNG